MTHEEKVLFLFSQTCTVLSSQSTPQSSPLGGAAIRLSPATYLTRNFDEVYSALAQKLKEKLDQQ
ncbi:hypothetical protein [Kosakonia sp. MUSA4]|uniref:hypothetical protein n=1 Tax=Kosakonia sp. MUSA4 TaxID=2067958 RepID=UPI00159853C5|nr:hypothetical protein [Kosakonia sp. MUSA4]QJT79600.1 hypothetical protein C0557_05720 [Kosakonia sp. MUSA4]